MRLSRKQSGLLEQLYQRHHQMVFRTALKFAAGDRDWAADCMQDVYVSVAKAIHRLDDLDTIEGWLYRVTVNTALKRLRGAGRWGRVLDKIKQFSHGDFGGNNPRETAQARRDVHRLEVDIAALPPLQRAVMVLMYFEGHSQGEAAALLGISKGYMSKIHAQALRFLETRDWELADG